MTPINLPPQAHTPTAYADLRMFRIFQHFPDEMLRKLAAIAQEISVPQGKAIYTEGDGGEDFYVIVAGSVEGARGTPVGRQLAVRLRVGQMFGHTSYLDAKPRPVTVVATQPTVLLRFDSYQVRSLIERDPELNIALLRAFWHAMATKIRQANQFMAEVFTQRDTIPHAGASAEGEQVELGPAKKLELFKERGLSAAELRLLAMTLTAQRFAPDAFIFVEGDKGDCLYIVVDGRVRISRRMTGMGEETLAILERGEVFGEMALVDDQPRSADARAHMEPATVLTLTQADLEEILNLPPTAASQFLRLLDCILCRRLRNMVDLLVSWRMMAGFGP